MKALISPEYLDLQKKMHSRVNYGTSGGKYSKDILSTGYKDILDYGCGKKSLESELNFTISNYDPCIEGLETNNTPHDFVYCGDVLEHIEPEFIDSVLEDIRRCMIREGLLVISTIPATKSLPDGRNAHLIVKHADWWRDKLKLYFSINSEKVKPDEYMAWVS